MRAAKSLEGKAGIGLGLLGLLGTVGEKYVGFLDRIGISKSPWNILAWLVLVVIAAAFYLREVSRVRRLIIRRPTTAFIGVNPFTERDQQRFFGRDIEIEEIKRKLIDDPQLDAPETASRAAEDLGEFGGLDNKLVTDALHQRLNAEMDQGNEGDIPLLTEAANSLVKLGVHDQVVLRALHRSIEKVTGIEEIGQSAKTLHDLRELDQQGVTLLRNRLGDRNPLIGSAVAKMLVDFNVRDEITLKTLRRQLDLSDSDVEEAAAYAELALIDPKRKFEEELEYLWQELVSPVADSSSGYRRAVEYAFKLSVEQQLNGKAGGKNAIDTLRTKLNELKGTAEIHRQIAANEILESIDGVVKKHEQNNSD